ncbi:MAG: epoxyqueuosine reductase [Desulfococcaceae bacterium]|jgi:epoxyqueuosine reductase|nr:epoxyqueuosine reductase [Desulfococcaceae bacterium]
MGQENTEELGRRIIAKAKEFGADLAGIANIGELKTSPSHIISEKLPEYDGEGTKNVAGRRRGRVEWPEEARLAIVIAVAHPPEKPEMDWWVSGNKSGNTPGNRILMGIASELADYLEKKEGLQCFKLPYYIEYGGVYMKDAAVLAGLGCMGKNNLFLTPEFGPRVRLRVMLTDADLPSAGKRDFDPCTGCSMPCRDVCPQNAFAKKIYSKAEYGMSQLPGRSGVFSRLHCNREMQNNNAAFETVSMEGRKKPGRRVKYCRECEFACPVGSV